jgi:hypothetical protein
VLVNVNFPDCAPGEVKGIAVTTQGKRDQEWLRIDARHDGRGNPYYWIAFARAPRPPSRNGTDLRALSDHWISVTPLRIDMTDEPFMTLAELFELVREPEVRTEPREYGCELRVQKRHENIKFASVPSIQFAPRFARVCELQIGTSRSCDGCARSIGIQRGAAWPHAFGRRPPDGVPARSPPARDHGCRRAARMDEVPRGALRGGGHADVAYADQAADACGHPSASRTSSPT